ncbi:MAG: transposase [Acidobacteria bacterium]|nr:transposase [Acidobacteriota bacterium]
MSEYRRHLPHWDPADRHIFVTWRLHGSLPAKVILGYKKWGTIQRSNHRAPNAGALFKKWDLDLDAGKTGPLWLKIPQVADAMRASLLYCAEQLQLYRLDSYVVMANHVHVLLLPNVPLRKITSRVKGFSARKANKILGRVGETFWQDESFDHWIRSEPEYLRIKNYIERNPVSAGLVAKPEDWPWSSAYQRA